MRASWVMAVRMEGSNPSRSTSIVMRVLRSGTYLGKGLQVIVRPCGSVVAAQMTLHYPHTSASFSRVNGGRSQQRVLYRVEVVRVAQECLAQFARRAGKLAEHERASMVGPRRHVFLCHQVHSVSQWGHHHHVGRAVERGQFASTVR